MIIADKWRSVTNWRVELSSWLRAPLYLSNGVRLFAAVDSESACRRYPEIVITDINPDYWSDLWRIEIDMLDGVGATSMLLDLLVQRRIEIIRSEGSVNSFNNNYSMSVIACARRYDGDGDVRDRIMSRATKLPALRAEILIYFGDSIAIDADGRPRLKVTRMTPYLVLQEELASGYRQLLSRDGFLLDCNSFTLTSPASRRLLLAALGANDRKARPRQSLLGADILYTAAVDTKSRILRLLLCREENSGLHHMQLYLRTSQTALAHVFGALKKVSANILRYQLRPLPERVSAAKFGLEEDAQKLDFTFEFKALKAEKVIERLSMISNSLATLTKAQGGPIVVSWQSWSTPDADLGDQTPRPNQERVRESPRKNLQPKQKSPRRTKPRSASHRGGTTKGGAEGV